MDLDKQRCAVDRPDPACAVLAGVLAFHAVRVRQLIALQLTDVHDGRLDLSDRVVPLAEPVRQRMNAYLDYRQQSWARHGESAPVHSLPHRAHHHLDDTVLDPQTARYARSVDPRGPRLRSSPRHRR
ncbi:hypothetical protein [Nocardia rhizosphaerae]|uniref:Tyr recombinase domain-containing protein n=1 Tax=Nocardia rhizosphaerae TaxID=1691571 RepID=A0ABV8L783_9NOCA